MFLALSLCSCLPEDPVETTWPVAVEPLKPTIPPPPPCPPDEAVQVEALKVQPTVFSQALVEVSLSAPADVAVACVLKASSLTGHEEVHLLEGAGSDRYTFDLGGLLSDKTYHCTAAAVCPTSHEPPVTVSVRTIASHPDIATATAYFDDKLEMTGAYTLTNAQPDCRGGPEGRQSLVIWDPVGRPRWFYPLPSGLNMGIEARWHGGTTVVWGGGKSPRGAPAIVDLFRGEQYKTTFPGSGGVIFHHDGKMLPDGRILTTEETREHEWASFRMHVIDPATGNIDWAYHSDQAIEQGALLPGTYYDDDPWHLNWADVVGETVLVSLCHTWQVAAIDMPTGQMIWKFGPWGDFSLVDPEGQPLGAYEFPQCQHGLEFDGDTLLVYDNGTGIGYSRATEYELDQEHLVATKTWEWSEPGWFETSLGDVDWLTDDHRRVLITEAHPECFTPSPSWVSQILEVDKESGTVVHRLVFDAPETSTYRAERLGGCDIFANASLCPALAQRLDALRPVLFPDAEAP